MKQIFKLIGGLLLGACIGFIGVTLIIALFTDLSLNTFFEKLQKIELLELIGVMLYSLIAFALSFALQIILHEGGHLVCGLLTGYRFVSFRIFNWVFIKEKGKLRIKHFSIAGTGGQCLLTPPDKPLKEIPVILYNLGGVAANLLTATLALVILLTTETLSYPLELFLIFMCIIGFFLGILNGIPFKMKSISNDATNLCLLLKDETSKQTLVYLLHMNALAQKGMRPKEMPKKYFLLPEKIDYKNSLQINHCMMVAGRMMDEKRWEECRLFLEDLMAHKDDILALFAKETACELLYLSLQTGNEERAKELYTDELSLYIQQHAKGMSSKQRVLCALALYLEKDQIKAQKIYDDLVSNRDQQLMQGEVKMDLDLMEYMLKNKS